MQKTVISRHVSESAFDAEIDGHVIRFDDQNGNSGPRPKAIILNSLAICSGFDVVPILNKMKVAFSDFSIVATADQSEGTPMVYTAIHLEFKIKIAPEHHIKMERAVKLSIEVYCGVYAMLIKVCPITYSITYL